MRFEEVAGRAVWKDDSIENGIVAVFLPKYPFSRVKKVMRKSKENYRKSFDYFQKDEAVLDEFHDAAAQFLQNNWNALAEYLKESLREKLRLSVDVAPRLTYKYGTLIKPVHPGEEYDVDLGVYFEVGQSEKHRAHS